MKRPLKFKNQPVEIDGVKYDSKREARRGAELRLLERAGEITFLRQQVHFPLVVNDKLVCTYIADFAYVDEPSGVQVVEDVKSPATRKLPAYRIKSKLLKALHGIEIREIA